MAKITEKDRVDAINFMADAMQETAKYTGPGLDCIGGDKTILAERALNALLKNFKISR